MLKEMRDSNFSQNTKNLNRYDIAIWRLIQSLRKCVTASSPMRIDENISARVRCS